MSVTTCEACFPFRPQSQHWPALADESRVYMAGGIEGASDLQGTCPFSAAVKTSMVRLVKLMVVETMVVVVVEG